MKSKFSIYYNVHRKKDLILQWIITKKFKIYVSTDKHLFKIIQEIKKVSFNLIYFINNLIFPLFFPAFFSLDKNEGKRVFGFIRTLCRWLQNYISYRLVIFRNVISIFNHFSYNISYHIDSFFSFSNPIYRVASVI